MNLIEALKTGKPIRRKGRSTWSKGGVGWHNGPNAYFDPEFYLTDVGADRADILADDWEVKPEPREWTICDASDTRETRRIRPYDPGNETCSECVHVREVLP